MPLDYSWSRLIHTDLGRMAQINYSADPRIRYHDWTHILRGYQHAKNMFGFDYDVNVDAAWLGHDWVYDEHPDKELRSIDMFHEALLRVDPIDSLDLDIVDELIESTINHSLVPDARVIHMDLGDLTLPVATMANYEAIKAESKNLYGITDAQFAEGSVNFMTAMQQTMLSNARLDTTNDFWPRVSVGVQETIAMSERLLAES